MDSLSDELAPLLDAFNGLYILEVSFTSSSRGA